MISDPDGLILGSAPGLPDDAFEHDGLITKRLLRATAIALLRPMPGELLWDLGAGAGSVAIEWCRGAAGARAVAVERVPERAARVAANAIRLTQAGAVRLVREGIEDAIGRLPTPDAVFIGGGATDDVVAGCVTALGNGGRLLVHGVTVEAEEVCVAAHRRWGGQLARLHVEQAEPIGRLTGWTPSRTLVSWALTVGEPR